MRILLKVLLALLSKLKAARLAFAYALLGYTVSFSVCTAQSTTLKIAIKDGRDGPVANAVVMLEPSDGRAMPSRLGKRDVAVDQVDREFVPKVTIASLGAKLSFPNRDVVQHSVYSFSKAKTFDIPIYAGESPQVLTLDKTGVVALGCNIHDWMLGYVVVVDSPVADLSKADGVVTFADLPKGKYNLRIWHPQLKTGEQNQGIELSDAEQRMDIKLELTPTRVRYKPPLKLKSY